jgi:tRNA 2-thiouridine synthesizing protein A
MMSIPNTTHGLGHHAAKVTCLRGHNTVDSLKYPAYLRRMTDVTETLDATGLLCPLPVLKARKRLRAMDSGATLQMLADDPAAIVDVPHFCAEAGHALITQSDAGSHQVYVIRKGG